MRGKIKDEDGAVWEALEILLGHRTHGLLVVDSQEIQTQNVVRTVATTMEGVRREGPLGSINESISSKLASSLSLSDRKSVV